MELFDALVRYETDLWNHLDADLRDAGAVSLATLTALRVVDRHRSRCRVQELRSDLGITVGAASKLVDRLERDGLATRRTHPDDRRSSLVDLTSSGEEAVSRGRELLESALAAHVSDVEDIDALTASLVRLDARLRTADVAR